MKTIASVALALACASVMAQSPAPTDVPHNHWAYPAVTNLYRLGILKGYPDGTFKGSRPATRFEMATALDAAVLDIKKITDALALQIADEKAKAEAFGEGCGKSDIVQLRDALAAIRSEVAGVRVTKTEVDGLKDDFQSLNEQLRAIRAIRASLAESRAKLDKTKGQ